jgi:NADPH:quinone reductase-like Zn-dependent oxidoreductase
MKAVVIDRYGGNEVVEVREAPLPTPGPADVLIRVRAASVNPVDWKIRNGMLRIFTGRSFPKILGSECAGEVVETGAGVKRFRKGDRVIGFPGIRRLGAFAQYVCVEERSAFPLPESITFEPASTLPIAGLTALQALRHLGPVPAGHEVLINGAAGGVGTFAVQLARFAGARVTAVCSAANAVLVRELGAERVIDYSREDFTQGTDRYDLIFDAVSKRSFAECKRVLAPHGLYIATLPAPSVLLNQYLTGFLTRKKARAIMVRPNAGDLAWLSGQIEAGRIRVVIDRVYPLEEVREALAYSETGKARGKVVLREFIGDAGGE